MKLNSFIFPAPPSSYSFDTEETIVWIPRKKTLPAKVLLISPNFTSPTHKKSSSAFDFKGKLFSPKYIFDTKKSNLNTFFRPQNKPFESIGNINIEKNSIMSKKALKFFLFNKKPTVLSNDDYSDRTNIDSKKDIHGVANSDSVPTQKKHQIKIKMLNPIGIISSPETLSIKAAESKNLFGLEDYQMDKKCKVSSSNFFFKKKRSPSDPFLKSEIFGNTNDSSEPVVMNKKNEIHTKTQKIPCILMQCPSGSNLTLLHFHGNAEDIGDCCKYMRKLSHRLKVLFFL